jgi:hypothetical protein
LLFPSSVFSVLQFRCFVFLKCCYLPTRLHSVTIQKTEISVLSFLELYIQMAGLTITARNQIAACPEGESGSPFHYSVSHFTFILLQKHIRECAVSSVFHFHRLLVAKRQIRQGGGGGEWVRAVGNNGSLSLQ